MESCWVYSYPFFHTGDPVLSKHFQMTCVIYSDKGSQGLCQNTFTCMLEIVMMTECLLLGGKKKKGFARF